MKRSALVGMVLTVACVSMSINALAGTLTLSDRGDRNANVKGYVYLFNSLASCNACKEEIAKTGGRGIKCDDLSIPIKEGTHAILKASHTGFKYVIISDGPYEGKGGYVGADNYIDID